MEKTSGLDAIVQKLRARPSADRLRCIRSRGPRSSSSLIRDERASILWIVLTNADGVKMKKNIKYVLLPEAEYRSLESFRRCVHAIVFRPSTQRLYEVQYFKTSRNLHWLQVMREHNLSRAVHAVSTPMPRGQRLISYHAAKN